MSLHRPYFSIEPLGDNFEVRHNCDGGLDFCSTTEVSEKTARLLEMAIAEGKRRRSREINSLLGDA